MENLQNKKNQYRVTSLVMFMVAIGLLVTRISISLLSSKISERMTDIVFTLISQVVVLGVVPFLLYRFLLKKKTKQIFALSSYRKVDIRIALLSLLLGLLFLFVTMGISSFWGSMLILVGFNYPMPTPLPATFSIWNLLIDICFTAMLPAIFEEFVNRGIFLNTMNYTLGKTKAIIVVGIAFGLFHQSVVQVFYTAFFGMVMAYLTLEFNSIYPAMITHFANNALSVYIDYARQYGLFGKGIYDWIIDLSLSNNLLLFFIYLLIVLAVIGVILLMRRININVNEKKGRVQEYQPKFLMGKKIKVIMPYENFRNDYLYKSTLGDNIFFIGALFTTIVSTVMSFIWGLL